MWKNSIDESFCNLNGYDAHFDIESLNPYQPDLFDEIRNRPERAKLMKAMDAINHRYGLKTIRLAVEGEKKQAWKVKSEHRSPNYLTDINELLTIRDEKQNAETTMTSPYS